LFSNKVDSSTEANLIGFHSDILVSYPIMENKVDLFGGIGLSQLYSTLRTELSTRTFSKMVPRFTVGLDLRGTERLKFRVHGTVERISEIHAPVKIGHNTALVGVGMIFDF
jgi:hypothetical protein